jgi:hypothetical protein
LHHLTRNISFSYLFLTEFFSERPTTTQEVAEELLHKIAEQLSKNFYIKKFVPKKIDDILSPQFEINFHSDVSIRHAKITMNNSISIFFFMHVLQHKKRVLEFGIDGKCESIFVEGMI